MGLDIGLERTRRFKTLAAVESVPTFCETIRVNRDSGHTHLKSMRVYEGDISLLDPEKVMADLKIEPGELDLLTGGPPCQAFSTSGRRASVEDPRGTLLWQFLRFVDVFQPKFFLMENVRGLMSASLKHRLIANRPENGGPPLEPTEEPGSVVDSFLADLHGDYRLDIFEVNAANYGAPQIRERVLFIGNRLNHLVEFPAPSHGQGVPAPDQANLFGPEVAEKPFSTLKEALDGLYDPHPIILDFSPRKKKYLEMVPPGSNWRSLPVEVAQESMGKAFSAKGGRSGWWRRLTWDLPCPTVVTMPNHASTSLCHPTETRALTLRECARIQEFPDDWKFCGTPVEQYIQVGNAVPVRLGQIAGKLIATHLVKAHSEGYDIRQVSLPSIRKIYLRSHIRTRRWFKAGETLVWGDSEEQPSYGSSKTDRREARHFDVRGSAGK